MKTEIIMAAATVAVAGIIAFVIYREGIEDERKNQTIQKFEDNNAARARKESVPSPDSASTVARLQQGTY